MIAQKFKENDLVEQKMYDAGKTAFDICASSLDQFYAGGYDANPFLLMLYDEGRMPFAGRVPRDSFLEFFRGALQKFKFTGTFETYIFILKAIFGETSLISFTVPGPGQLEILVNAAAAVDFDFISTEFQSGAFVENQIVDSDGAQLTFVGISGIDSEYELSQLLAELIPAGIYPEVTLAYYDIFNFVADEGGDPIDMITSNGDTIIFIEF